MMKNENVKNWATDKEDRYTRKCIKSLKEKNLPLTGWECIEVYDCKEVDRDAPLEVCEVCGCDKVRYVHVMQNQSIELHVGCICSGVMEGDVMKAKERDRLMKNRAARKQNFMKKKWKRVCKGYFAMTYKSSSLVLKRTEVGVAVMCGTRAVWNYKGKRISNYSLASHAAFDLIDPIPEVD